jgi:hypothetical protein
MTLATALLTLTLAHPHGYGDPAGPPPPNRYAARSRGMVGLVFLPLGSAQLSAPDLDTTYSPEVHGALALEIRSPYPYSPFSGARFRAGAELSRHDRVFDVSFKYNFFDPGPFQPFLTLGVGVANLSPESDWRSTFSASAGIDFFLTPNFFLSLEFKGRGFGDPSTSTVAAGDSYGGGVTQSTALFGLGVYF